MSVMQLNTADYYFKNIYIIVVLINMVTVHGHGHGSQHYHTILCLPIKAPTSLA